MGKPTQTEIQLVSLVGHVFYLAYKNGALDGMSLDEYVCMYEL